MLNWTDEAIASSEPCAVDHCGDFAVDPHHRKQRSAGGSDNPENIVFLCRRHHDWTHDKIDYAHSLGLIIYDHEPEPTERMTSVRTRPTKPKPERPEDSGIEFELSNILGVKGFKKPIPEEEELPF